MSAKARPPLWLSLTVAASCLLALGDWPYGYYQLLRLIVTGYAAWIAFHSAALSRLPWLWVFGFIALLYNPLFKISMSRDAHAVENVATAVAVVIELLRARRLDGTA